MSNSELDNLFRDLLASNRVPGYVVSVIEAASDLLVFDVDLRFIAGRTYCCAEPGCHVPSDREQKRLHQFAAGRAISLPDTVTVRWHCHVERGVMLGSPASSGVAPRESEAYDFEVAYGGGAVG